MTVLTPIASVVIPAHNEGAIIGRNLSRLCEGMWEDQVEVLVVCNGCDDDTAERAREAFPGVRILEIGEPSKAEAMRVGNEVSSYFPRVHLDADVVLGGRDLERLVEPLRAGRVLAAAPQRVLVTARSSVGVRWYYDVWQRLPQVRLRTLRPRSRRTLRGGPAASRRTATAHERRPGRLGGVRAARTHGGRRRGGHCPGAASPVGPDSSSHPRGHRQRASRRCRCSSARDRPPRGATSFEWAWTIRPSCPRSRCSWPSPR